jgi:hypothetical protein
MDCGKCCDRKVGEAMRAFKRGHDFAYGLGVSALRKTFESRSEDVKAQLTG